MSYSLVYVICTVPFYLKPLLRLLKILYYLWLKVNKLNIGYFQIVIIVGNIYRLVVDEKRLDMATVKSWQKVFFNYYSEWKS